MHIYKYRIYIHIHNTSKQDVEIVISRFNEEIGWSDMYASIRTVYDKSGNNSFPLTAAGNVISIPNLVNILYMYTFI
jgi:hypothetical protein